MKRWRIALVVALVAMCGLAGCSVSGRQTAGKVGFTIPDGVKATKVDDLYGDIYKGNAGDTPELYFSTKTVTGVTDGSVAREYVEYYLQYAYDGTVSQNVASEEVNGCTLYYGERITATTAGDLFEDLAPDKSLLLKDVGNPVQTVFVSNAVIGALDHETNELTVVLVYMKGEAVQSTDRAEQLSYLKSIKDSVTVS